MASFTSCGLTIAIAMLGGQLFVRQEDAVVRRWGNKGSRSRSDILAVSEEDFVRASLKDARLLCRVWIT